MVAKREAETGSSARVVIAATEAGSVRADLGDREGARELTGEHFVEEGSQGVDVG
jgi:hypothetical protein